MAVVILYTLAGLRRGELARLVLVKISSLRLGFCAFGRRSSTNPDWCRYLRPPTTHWQRAYLRQRLAAPFDTDPSLPRCWCCGRHGHRGVHGCAGLGQAINRLLVAADVLDAEGRRPRVHDMRHSFAVQALMRWYRATAPTSSPTCHCLAIYMGHVSIVSTAHYLHFVPAMRQLASDRFEVAFGDVIEEVKA